MERTLADTRRKNVNWNIPEKLTDWDQCIVAVLMDIRDELQAVNSKLSCYRVPRALDALHEVGVDIRRKQRTAAKKRKTAKAKGGA